MKTISTFLKLSSITASVSIHICSIIALINPLYNTKENMYTTVAATRLRASRPNSESGPQQSTFRIHTVGTPYTPSITVGAPYTTGSESDAALRSTRDNIRGTIKDLQKRPKHALRGLHDGAELVMLGTSCGLVMPIVLPIGYFAEEMCSRDTNPLRVLTRAMVKTTYGAVQGTAIGAGAAIGLTASGAVQIVRGVTNTPGWMFKRVRKKMFKNRKKGNNDSLGDDDDKFCAVCFSSWSENGGRVKCCANDHYLCTVISLIIETMYN